MVKETIAVIEDDESIREIIGLTLKADGYTNLFLCADGESGLRCVQEKIPSLVLLDLMLPGLDGFEICRRMKANKVTEQIPVIMLTAKSEESDIVHGLELGASDYMTKPFSPKVLIARVHAVLRRPSEADRTFQQGGLFLNPQTHEVFVDGVPVKPLTLTEFKILHLLLSRPGRVYTRGQIINGVQDGEHASTDRAVDVQMVNLRRKLGVWSAHVETIRGIGYRLK